MKKISERKAFLLFNEGATIILTPSNCSPTSELFALAINKATTNGDFEALVNSFYYYSCNRETGNKIHYYIK